jgi:GntR family transcriptional regulator
MPGETIDRESADPPYQQVAAILRARIERGQITNRLPGERDLQAEFGVALITARKAIKLLREEGLIRTVPGWGSFVKDRG